MEDHGRQKEANALGSAINCPCQASRLSCEVKAQVQLQQMLVYTARHLSYSLLRNACEYGISKFLR